MKSVTRFGPSARARSQTTCDAFALVDPPGSQDAAPEPPRPTTTAGAAVTRRKAIAAAVKEPLESRCGPHDGSFWDELPPDPFSQTRANQFAAESGRSAQHLDLVASAVEAAQAARPVSDWTRRRLASVIRAVRDGAGQGRGDRYRPWIRIRRNFSSPVSYQIFESVGINARNHHLLSQLEFHTALLTAYLGISHELREGLPMWPFDHPHPDADLGTTDLQTRYVPGLLEIAREAGIEHGHYVGSTVPYIGTIDLVHTIRVRGRRMLLGISCKPAEVILDHERSRERLELDRRYCAAVGAHHVVEHGHAFDARLLKQLRDYKPLTSQIRAHRGTSRLADFAGTFDGAADSMPVSDAAKAAATKVGLDAAEGFLFLRLCIWLHLIDIDLTQPLQMGWPIRRGAQRVLGALYQRYLGDCHA